MIVPAAREVADRLQAAGLSSLLASARERIERLDGVRGTVRVELSAEGLEALAGLLGSKRLPIPPADGQVPVRLQELDERLRESRYRVGLVAVLEADSGPLVTRREREDAAARRWAGQLAEIMAASPAAARDWVTGLDSDGPAARWYRRAYRENPAAARDGAVAVAQALAELPLPGGELLAVFAARITGDPHSFDVRRPAGALLLISLEERYGPAPQGMAPAEARSLLLGQVGLEVDGMSSTVLAAHLNGADHPVLNAMAASGGGWPLPLAEVRRFRFAPAAGPVYVVENPQVFEYLVRGLGVLDTPRRPPLVCPAGFPSAASVRLLDALRAAGYTLRYSGDFDRQGIVIARWVLERYPHSTLWRMEPENYQSAVSGWDVTIGTQGGNVWSNSDKSWLEILDGPLASTARAMVAAGRPAYQERLVEVLLSDLLAKGRK